MAFKFFTNEKCVRCRKKPAKQEVDGMPTCDTCEALLRSEREEPRECPACQVAMAKQLVKLVVIDKCTKCGGVWLDAGELELVRQAASDGSGGGGDFATGMLLGMAMG